MLTCTSGIEPRVSPAFFLQRDDEHHLFIQFSICIFTVVRVHQHIRIGNSWWIDSHSWQHRKRWESLNNNTHSCRIQQPQGFPGSEFIWSTATSGGNTWAERKWYLYHSRKKTAPTGTWPTQICICSRLGDLGYLMIFLPSLVLKLKLFWDVHFLKQRAALQKMQFVCSSNPSHKGSFVKVTYYRYDS